MRAFLFHVLFIWLFNSHIYGYGSLGQDTTVCKNKCVVLKMPAPGFSDVIWSTGDTTKVFAAGYSVAELTVCPIATDTFWAKVISSSDSILDTDTIIVNVVDQNYPILLDSNYLETCMGDCIKLKGVSGGLSYSWSPTNGIDSPDIANPTICVNYLSNDFSVHVVSDTNWNCEYNFTLHIKTAPEPSILSFNEVAICKDSCVDLSGPSGGQIYKWIPSHNISDTNKQTIIACPSSTISYTVFTITDTAIDCTYMDTIIVNVSDSCFSTETDINVRNSIINFFYNKEFITIRSTEPVETNFPTTLEIFNIAGQLIYSKGISARELSTGFAFQTEFLPDELYFIRVFYKNSFFTHRILIKR